MSRAKRCFTTGQLHLRHADPRCPVLREMAGSLRNAHYLAKEPAAAASRDLHNVAFKNGQTSPSEHFVFNLIRTERVPHCYNETLGRQFTGIWKFRMDGDGRLTYDYCTAVPCGCGRIRGGKWRSNPRDMGLGKESGMIGRPENVATEPSITAVGDDLENVSGRERETRSRTGGTLELRGKTKVRADNGPILQAAAVRRPQTAKPTAVSCAGLPALLASAASGKGER